MQRVRKLLPMHIMITFSRLQLQICIIIHSAQQAGLKPISYRHTLVPPSLFLAATRDAASRLSKEDAAAAAAAAAVTFIHWRPLVVQDRKRQRPIQRN